MEPALVLKDVSKIYPKFTLQPMNLTLPAGRVLGLIGENGAGKTTLINLLLHELSTTSGTISIFGKDLFVHEKQIKKELGVVFDACHFIEIFTVRDIEKMFERVYETWDHALFQSYINRFSLPTDQKIKEFSKGMKVKLNFACALAHHPSFLILDEATSGLDPIMRDEILDLLSDFMIDESHTILMSSHITSDLEKIADDIAFIHEGSLLFHKPKEELLDQYGILHCGQSLFESLDAEDVIAWQKEEYAYHVLIKDRSAFLNAFPDACMDVPTIDEIMIFMVKGAKQ